MSYQVISILVLVAAFVLATVLPINLGALSLVAAFVIGDAGARRAARTTSPTRSSPASPATCS